MVVRHASCQHCSISMFTRHLYGSTDALRRSLCRTVQDPVWSRDDTERYHWLREEEREESEWREQRDVIIEGTCTEWRWVIMELQLGLVRITISVLSKLCPRGAQTCALPLFCNCDPEINLMTLKLEDDLDILKMYPHTEDEVARSSYSKYIAWIKTVQISS